jgi:hypothetical protein
MAERYHCWKPDHHNEADGSGVKAYDASTAATQYAEMRFARDDYPRRTRAPRPLVDSAQSAVTTRDARIALATDSTLTRDANRLLRTSKRQTATRDGRERYAAGGHNRTSNTKVFEGDAQRDHRAAPETRTRTPMPIVLTDAERAEARAWCDAVCARMRLEYGEAWQEWRRKWKAKQKDPAPGPEGVTVRRGKGRRVGL